MISIAVRWTVEPEYADRRPEVAEAPDHVDTTPRITSIQGVPGEGWGEMGEVQPR